VIDNGRQRGEAAVVHAGRGGLTSAPGIDAPALNVLLIGGISSSCWCLPPWAALPACHWPRTATGSRARLALRALMRGVYRTSWAGADTLPDA